MSDITLSVVSHRQNAFVNQLLEDIGSVCVSQPVVIVTENIADSVVIESTFPAERIVNQQRKGFGANHNAAFKRCRTPYFCVANPDIRLAGDPFPQLRQGLALNNAGVCGPAVLHPSGSLEDSARRFPSVRSLLMKALKQSHSGPDYPVNQGVLQVDWIGGMFMLFRTEVFAALGGFDERYFLYYEDVDICARLGASGRKVLFNPAAEIVHNARRGSRRNLRLALHHGSSALRYLTTRYTPTL